MHVRPLDGCTLGAVVTGVRITDLDDHTWAAIEAAFHEHAVLVFPGQHLETDEQVAFARRFGEIEVLFTGYDAVPISTIDGDGRVLEPEHPVMQVVRGNQGWHTDSSYMPVSAKASLLSAKVVPSAGGETEWADMRAAYDALDEATKQRIADLAAHHSIAYSQAKAGFDSTLGYGMAEPDQLRPLVKHHPATGRPALFIGRHAHAVPGLDPSASDALLAGLLDHATRPPFTYRHAWTPGDLVVWDNRCVLHRACEWDLAEPRVRRHTRVAGDPVTERSLTPAP
jgi:alpha-ketoglutarate-dependent taurine dioxygenase